LDEVNNDTVAEMIPDVPAHAVVDWFRSEASIRDASSKCFVVNPFIREMVLQHHRNVLGRKSQDKWINKGKEAYTNAQAT
jgi:hypothetical protein